MGWFYIALVVSWGYTPGAWFYWTLAAYPLGNGTMRWLERNETPVPAHHVALTQKWWVRLAWFQLGFTVFAWAAGDHGEAIFATVWAPMMWAYAIYPAAVTGWAIWVSLRHGRRGYA
jgi:hypothetical protein